MSLARLSLAIAALAAAAIAPSAAQAAEGFTAVTTDARVVHFHSDTHPGLTAMPVKVRGLSAGETIVGLDRAPSRELLALTSAGRLEVLDGATGKATPKFAAPVTAPIAANAPLTFAVAPDGASARIITTGRDVSVNLRTGAATPGAGLTFAAGDTHAGAQATPALDYAADGRLVGVAGAQQVYAAQTAPGAATLSSLAKAPFPAREPVRSTVGSDGSVWTTADLGTKHTKQSRFVRYDPATGAISGQDGVFFFIRLAALSADGPVADDHTAPKATFEGAVLKRRVVHKLAFWGGLRLRISEPGQTVGSLRLGGKVVGFGLLTTDLRGTYTMQFGSTRKGADALRRAAAAHRRALVRLTVRDWAGNKRVYERAVRLSS